MCDIICGFEKKFLEGEINFTRHHPTTKLKAMLILKMSYLFNE